MVDAFNEARMFLLQQAADKRRSRLKRDAASWTGRWEEDDSPTGGAAAPQGPKATQGMEPLNPMADNGGAPLRGR